MDSSSLDTARRVLGIGLPVDRRLRRSRSRDLSLKRLQRSAIACYDPLPAHACNARTTRLPEAPGAR
jgi:hypothetical protein